LNRLSSPWALLVILLFLAAPPCPLKAQGPTDEDDIRTTLGLYWDAVQRKDHEATLSYIDPKLFVLVPRERMLEALERSSADTTVRVNWGQAEVTKVSRPIKEGESRYAGVDYRFDLRMWLSSEPDTDQERKAAFLTDMLEEQYGKGNVRYDSQDDVYVIHAERRMIAELDPRVGAWRFLERKKGMEPLLEQLVPARVLRKLK